MDEPPDAGLARGVDDVPGALGVDEPEALAAVEVPRDRGEVDDRVDAGHGRRQRRGLGDVADPRLHGVPLRRVSRRRRTSAASSSLRTRPTDAVAGVDQRRDDVAADESRRAGDEDRGHGVCSGGAPSRKNWLLHKNMILVRIKMSTASAAGIDRYHRGMTDLDQRTVRAIARAMPKAELHLHLDGSLRIDTALDIARTRDDRRPHDVRRHARRARRARPVDRPGRAAQGVRPPDRPDAGRRGASSGSRPTSSRTRRATTSATPRSAGRRCSTPTRG